MDRTRRQTEKAARSLKTASAARVHGDESERLAKRSGTANPRQAQKKISKKAPRGPLARSTRRPPPRAS